MKNFTLRLPQSGHSFTKLGHFFPIFEKGQERPHPTPQPPPLVTRLIALIYLNSNGNSKIRIKAVNRNKGFNNLFRIGRKYKKADIIYYMLTSLVSLQQGNVKKSKKLVKIVNSEGENLHIF